MSGIFTSYAIFEIKADERRQNVLPVAQYSATPITGFAPLLVSFNALESYDSDGSIVSFDWDFNDGNFASGAVINHLFQNSGNYIVKLTVTDNQGGVSSISYSLNVLNNIRPIADFTYTTVTDLGDLNVQLDGSKSLDPDGQIQEYNWDFGDGSAASGIAVNYQYKTPGTYEVKLSVTDNIGAITTVFKLVEVFDRRSPILTFTSPENNKIFFAQSIPLNISVIGSSDEPLSEITFNSNIVDISSNNKSFDYVLNISNSGEQIISVKAKDRFDNLTELNIPINIVIDNQPPSLLISSKKTITNLNRENVIVSVTDTNQVSTEIWVNDSSIKTTSEKQFTIEVPLDIEGVNKIEAQATDIAGNKSERNTINITRDSVAPQLSDLVPQNDTNIDRIAFPVSGRSNEKLTSLNINGMFLKISSDGLSFSGTYVAPNEGPQTLNWTAVDLAGNEKQLTTTVTT